MSDMNNPADDNNGAMDDLWAEALNIALDQLNMLKQYINKTTNYGEDS